MSQELLVGYGHDPAADRALDVAADLAVRLGTRLRVLHVVGADDYSVDPDSATFDADAEAHLRKQHTHVDKRLSARGDEVGWEHEVRRGEPVAVLARAADDHDALMIVVGARGGGPANLLSRVLEPSVSHGLIRHQTRPVLVVPGEG